jgi:hypothetical protein
MLSSPPGRRLDASLHERGFFLGYPRFHSRLMKGLDRQQPMHTSSNFKNGHSRHFSPAFSPQITSNDNPHGHGRGDAVNINAQRRMTLEQAAPASAISQGGTCTLGSWSPPANFSNLPAVVISPLILRFLTHLDAAGLASTSRRIRDLIFSNAMFGSIRTLSPHLENVAVVARNRLPRKEIKSADATVMVYKAYEAGTWVPAVRSLLEHGLLAGEHVGPDHQALLARCDAWINQAGTDASTLPEDEVLTVLAKVSDNSSTAQFLRELLVSAKHGATGAADDYLQDMLAELRKLVLESALDAISANLIAPRAQEAMQAQAALAAQANVSTTGAALPAADRGFTSLPGVLIAPMILRFLIFLEAASLAGTCTRVRIHVVSDPSHRLLRPLGPYMGNVHTLAFGGQSSTQSRVDAARRDVAAFKRNPALWMPTVESLLAPGIPGEQQICPAHQAMLRQCEAWLQQADTNAANIPSHNVLALMQRVGAPGWLQGLLQDVLDTVTFNDPAATGARKLKVMLPMVRELVLESALDALSLSPAAQPLPTTASPSPSRIRTRDFYSGHHALLRQCQDWQRQAFKNPARLPVDEVMAVVRSLGVPAPEQLAMQDALQAAARQDRTGEGAQAAMRVMERVREVVNQSLFEITIAALPAGDSPGATPVPLRADSSGFR